MEFVKNTSIKCDKCGWNKSIEFENVPDWHNEKCPKCSDAIIVDDHDLQQWNFTASLAHLQNALGYKEGEEDTGWVKIDTAKSKEENN